MLKTIDINSVLECAHKSLITGNYEEGLKRLRFFWDYEQPEKSPLLQGLNQLEIANLLQSCGFLYGFYGVRKSGTQEIAKNLLTTAYRMFGELNLPESQLACSNFLALTEQRLGNVDNARVWLDASFAFDLPDYHKGKMHAYVTESLINCTAGNYEPILDRLGKVKKLFDIYGDDYLRAMYHTHTGYAKTRLGFTGAAFNDLFVARRLYQKLPHRQYLSYAENNIAFLYLAQNDVTRAFPHAVRALSLAREIGDARQIGCVFDTFALIAQGLGCLERALFFSDCAINELKKTDCYSPLVEYFETKLKILLEMSQTDESAKNAAYKTYAEAYAIAHQYLDEAVCNRLTETLCQPQSNNDSKPQIANYKLKVKHKPSAPVHIVEIVSDDYEHFGLKESYFAVVEEREPTQGDLAAVIDKADSECFLGFVTLFSDLIMLEIGGGIDSPALSLDTVKILGVVIGYCLPKPDSNGDLKVIPLELRKV